MRSKALAFITFTFSLAVFVSSCSKENTDPCEVTLCLNDASCIDGSCHCRQGFSGVHCETEIPPVKMQLTDILVLSFPLVNGLIEPFDKNNDPDMTAIVFKGFDTIWMADIYYENVNDSFYYPFTPQVPIDIIYPLDLYRIGIYDYDGKEGMEWMASIFFRPYLGIYGFPKSYAVDDGSFSVAMWFTYEW